MENEIAIIGIAGKFPKAQDIDQLRSLFISGKKAVDYLSIQRKLNTGIDLSADYAPMASLQMIDIFDLDRFQMSKGEAEFFDPQLKLLLETVDDCFLHAGYDKVEVENSNTGVYVGDVQLDYAELIPHDDLNALVGTFNATAAGLISRQFALNGPSLLIEQGNSSSLGAISFAINDLLTQEIDQAVVAGVKINLFPEKNISWDGKKDPSDEFRRFELSNDFFFESENGEAVCALFLKEKSKALIDGDTIYATIKGVEFTQLSRSASDESKTDILKRFWQNNIRKFNIHPENIHAVEIIGNGDTSVHSVELDSLIEQYSTLGLPKQTIALTSLSKQLGNLGPVSGLVACIKNILALHNHESYPVHAPDVLGDNVDYITSPFYLNTNYRRENQDSVKTSLINAYGKNGIFAQLALQNETIKLGRKDFSASHLFVFSGNSRSELEDRKAKFLEEWRSADIMEQCDENVWLFEKQKEINSTSAEKKYRQLATLSMTDQVLINSSQVITVSRPDSHVWILASGNKSVSDLTILELRKKYTVFNKQWEELSGVLDTISLEVAKVFAYQVSYYHLLKKLGLPVQNMMGLGVGKIVISYIQNKLTLQQVEEELTHCKLLPDENPELQQKLISFVSKFSSERPLYTIDLLPDGEIENTLRTVVSDQLRCLSSDIMDQFLSNCLLHNINIDWTGFFDTVRLKRTPLTRTKIGTRCWIDNDNSLYSKLFVRNWTEYTESDNETFDLGGNVLVINVRDSFNEKYIQKLEQQKCSVFSVEYGSSSDYETISDHHIKLSPVNKQHWKMLMEDLRSKDFSYDSIVWIDLSDFQNASISIEARLVGLMELMQVHFEQADQKRLKKMIHICSSEDTISSSQNGNFYSAPVCSLVDVIGYEHQQIQTFNILIEKSAGMVEDFLDYIIEKSGKISNYTSQVLFENKWFIPLFKPKRAKGKFFRSVVGKSVLITGGTGGVGLQLAEHYGTSEQREIYIIGRKKLPPKNEWEYYAETFSNDYSSILKVFLKIEAKGSQVHYFSARLENREELDEIKKIITERSAKIETVIHTAGIAGSALLTENERSVYLQVLGPKVKGTINVYHVFGEEADQTILFSSDNAILPADYCSDYGPANAFLDAFAAAKTKDGKKVISINWTAWREAGMWKRFYSHFEASTVEKMQTITTAEGVAVIEIALQEKGLSNLVVSCFHPDQYGENKYFKADKKNFSIISHSDLQSGEDTHAVSSWEIINPEWSQIKNITASIWKDVLRLDTLDMDLTFFEMGGHSILALKILNRLKHVFPSVPYNHKDIFVYNTLNLFTEYLENQVKNIEEERASINEIPKAASQTMYDLSPAQMRLWLDNELDEEKLVYLIPGNFSIPIDFDKQILYTAVNDLWCRHASLRTIFKQNEDLPYQFLLDKELGTSLIREIRVEKDPEYWISKELNTPFDLSTGPLIRCLLINVNDEYYQFVYVLHHIICDGWSYNLLSNELSELIRSHVKKRKPNLASKEIEYIDYSEWFNSRLQSGDIEKQRAFMLNEFSVLVSRIQLPVDFPEKSNFSFEGGILHLKLDGEVFDDIRQFVKTNNTTLFSYLFTTFNVMFHRLTQQEDLVIGTVLSGRNHHQLENIVGMFVNTLPLRNYPQKDQTFQDFLTEVTDRNQLFFDNQDFQYENLIFELKKKGLIAGNSLFDVLFELNIGTEEQDGKDKKASIDSTQISGNMNMNKLIFNLILTVEEFDEGIVLIFNYKKDFFKKETIQFYRDCFEQIVLQTLQNPNKRLADFYLINELITENNITLDENSFDFNF